MIDLASLPIFEYVTFELVIPLCFNPAPGEEEGRPIPEELLSEVEDTLQGSWGPFSAWDGYGRSTSVRGQRVRDPQRYFLIDVPRERAAAAWDWFAAQCPEWARCFGQEEIYLRIPAQGLTYRFPPAGAARYGYANPLRALAR
jgi:hypothetical protein